MSILHGIVLMILMLCHLMIFVSTLMIYGIHQLMM